MRQKVLSGQTNKQTDRPRRGYLPGAGTADCGEAFRGKEALTLPLRSKLLAF